LTQNKIVYTLHIRCIPGTIQTLPDRKKYKKKNKKDSQLVVRINGLERDRFVALCDELDTSSAREIRKFIRDFMLEHDTQVTYRRTR
jgi:hypothetical protein